MSKTKAVRIVEIRIDGGTQQRVEIDNSIVAEYAEAMKCGAKFPPVTLFFDGVVYWLADGFHRYHASKTAEMLDILGEIHDGINRDAILYSTGANGTHGIRLTNDDKRKAVSIMLSDKEWSTWSDREIAKHCKVTQPFVSKLRKPEPKTKPEITTPAKGVITVITPPLEPAPVLDVKIATSHNTTENEAKHEHDDGAPSDEEMSNAIKEHDEEIESMRRICESEDKIASALGESKRYREQLRIIESRNNGLMGELSAAKKKIASLERKIAKMEKVEKDDF